METKRLINLMLISLAVILGWQLVVAQLYEHHPEWKRPGQETEQTTEQAATQTTGQSAPTTAATQAIASTAPAPGAATQAAASTMVAPLHVVTPATQPASVTLGDSDKFQISANLSSIGASIDSVTLKKFADVSGKGPYVFQKPYDDSGKLTRSLATRSVTIGDDKVDVSNVPWHLVFSDAQSATFMLDLGVVRLRKTFALTPTASPGEGFEMTVSQEIENLTPKPVKVQLGTLGPTAPPRESERSSDLQVMSAYDDGYQQVSIDHDMVDAYNAKNPQKDLTQDKKKHKLLWFGACSVYFNAIVRPVPLQANATSANYIGSLSAEATDPASDSDSRHVVMTFDTSELTVAPGKPVTIASSVFLGPRWRQVLQNPYYSEFPLSYDQTLVMINGMCSVCTFTWMISGLVFLLRLFHWVFGGFAGHGDWGLAIIALVVVVRVILHPITKRSQVAMVKMGKMGPEMERLKKKYADNKDELNKQMMLVYKEQGIGAYLGCLPMFLQTPIWIALWGALQSTFELRHATFLWGFTWIKDLARADHALSWTPIHIPLPLLGTVPFSGLNLLPIIMALVMYFQQKYTPQPMSASPDQEKQKKMMMWMSVLMFPVFLYNEPSGLNLYILTSSTIGIFESKRIRQHIKEREEAEKAGRIIIDAPKSMKKRKGEDSAGQGKNQPKKGIAGWLQQMQNRAEELRRQSDRGGK